MIVVKNLYKRFGKNEVLKGVNFRIDDGETVVIVGKSGTGKSVMIKCIVGLLNIDQGEIWIDGIRIDKAKEKEINYLRKRFGYVFQNAALFDWMTVLENVMLPLVEMGMNRKLAAEKAIYALENVGLKNVENKYPSELSGGMRKRVGIARAIVSDPDYLFYDEPTSGLDPYTSRLIYDLMQELNEKLSCTTLIITHDIELVKRFGDRVMYLEDGKITFDGRFEEAKNSKSFSEFIGDYIHYVKGR